MNIKRTRAIDKIRVATQDNNGETKTILISIDQDDVLEYAYEHYHHAEKTYGPSVSRWNGRQIRNAFQTAYSLALYKAVNGQEPRLDKEQFIQVTDATIEFDRYLYEIHQKDENERAAYRSERAEHFETVSEAGSQNLPRVSHQEQQGTPSRRFEGYSKSPRSRGYAQPSSGAGKSPQYTTALHHERHSQSQETLSDSSSAE